MSRLTTNTSLLSTSAYCEKITIYVYNYINILLANYYNLLEASQVWISVKLELIILPDKTYKGTLNI